MDPKQDENTQPHKREWVKPEVVRIEAGSAEDGGAVSPDGFNPS